MRTKGNTRPIISVFGSHAPKTGGVDYEQAREVGRLLAEAGFAVSTGGYEGTMGAVSQGAAEANGYVIGVTSTQVETSRPVAVNQWVEEVITYQTLRERVLHLVQHNQGMIVLPGGIGTLSEFALAWSLLQVNEISPRPLVLLGHLWRDTLKAFVRSEYLPEKYLNLVTVVETPREAVSFVKNWPY